MTKKEASERYHIPVGILEEYERWNLCNDKKRAIGEWQYDDADFKLMGIIMTLHDIGFERDEIERYMRLYLRGDATSAERTGILNQKRELTLKEIHLLEKRLELLDYFRYKTQNGCGLK